jgi:hypothetical protein
VKPHPFQPLAAVLGIGVIALGVLVTMFGVERLEDDVLVWTAVGAALIGVALIPWRRRESPPSA